MSSTSSLPTDLCVNKLEGEGGEEEVRECTSTFLATEPEIESQEFKNVYTVHTEGEGSTNFCDMSSEAEVKLKLEEWHKQSEKINKIFQSQPLLTRQIHAKERKNKQVFKIDRIVDRDSHTYLSIYWCALIYVYFILYIPYSLIITIFMLAFATLYYNHVNIFKMFDEYYEIAVILKDRGFSGSSSVNKTKKTDFLSFSNRKKKTLLKVEADEELENTDPLYDKNAGCVPCIISKKITYYSSKAEKFSLLSKKVSVTGVDTEVECTENIFRKFECWLLSPFICKHKWRNKCTKCTKCTCLLYTSPSPRD